MLFQFVCIICFVGVINAAAIQQKKSSADCEWITFEQPLSHFTPGVIGKTFQQRICINKEYWKPNSNLPVLFYTGNESPVNEYVDNTGLMWDLAKELNALIIFAEHRYFGESIPEINGVENCMAYLTSSEALADYALFLNTIKNDNTGKWGVGNVPIIAFGGSYGGMLSSWMRIKYPSLITGSISASAPVLGFPMDNCQLDASSRPVTYATSNEAGSSKYCSENLKKSYVLLYDINKYNWGKQLLSKHMNLCTPLSNNNDNDIYILLEYLQSPLFDLAEGSYPFETDYITYALTSSHSPLPAWAMNVMCNDIGNDNYNIKIENKINTSNTDVEFTVSVKAKDNDNDNDNDNEVKIDVNWDKTTNNNYTEDILLKTRSLDLLHDVAQSIQVWYNVTGDGPNCIDWAGQAPAPNLSSKVHTGVGVGVGVGVSSKSPLHRVSKSMETIFRNKKIANTNTDTDTDTNTNTNTNTNANTVCTATKEDIDVSISWGSLVCNEGMNLINTAIHGIGNDLYWPPNVNSKNYNKDSIIKKQLLYCNSFDQLGMYGVPNSNNKNLDYNSMWLNTLYGGKYGLVKKASNIYYTNGDLDPWGPAGISPSSKDNENENDVISRTIKQGGHHLDLFWQTNNDPKSVIDIREEEKLYIRKWISEAQAEAQKDKEF